MIYEPLTKLQCSPTSDGAAAAILASEDFVDRHGLADRAIEIVGQSLVTDYETSLSTRRARDVIGYDMNVQAARAVYEQSGLGPEDFQVIELHDCFSANELLLYEALGLADEGEGPRLVDDGDTTYGGKWVVNPSGGLISKGHPLGATGLAQCTELTWQLRGDAGGRQVEDVEAALQHNIGLGGTAVVTAYRRASLTMSTETLNLDEARSEHGPRSGSSRSPRERIAQYALATNDPIEAHLEGEVAPPVFAIVPVFQSLVEPALEVVPPALLGRSCTASRTSASTAPCAPATGWSRAER